MMSRLAREVGVVLEGDGGSPMVHGHAFHTSRVWMMGDYAALEVHLAMVMFGVADEVSQDWVRRRTYWDFVYLVEVLELG